jgi:hypothetical protein
MKLKKYRKYLPSKKALVVAAILAYSLGQALVMGKLLQRAYEPLVCFPTFGSLVCAHLSDLKK